MPGVCPVHGEQSTPAAYCVVHLEISTRPIVGSGAATLTPKLCLRWLEEAP